MGTRDDVLAALQRAGKPLKRAELAAAGVDQKDVDKALKDLKKEGAFVSPKACYSSLA